MISLESQIQSAEAKEADLKQEIEDLQARKKEAAYLSSNSSSGRRRSRSWRDLEQEIEDLRTMTGMEAGPRRTMTLLQFALHYCMYGSSYETPTIRIARFTVTLAGGAGRGGGGAGGDGA